MVDQPAQSSQARAIRLLVSYDGDQLTVIDRRPVDTPAPPSDPIQGFEGQSGFWFELRDAQSNVLYRRVASNPIQQEVEAFEPDGTATRHVIEKPSGVFTVLVPDVPEADHVAVVSSPRAAHLVATAAAGVVATLPIRGPLGQAGGGQ